MIDLDLSTSAKLAVKWIILQSYYVVDLILDSIWITLVFYCKFLIFNFFYSVIYKPNINNNIIDISSFQNDLTTVFSSTDFYLMSKVVEGIKVEKYVFQFLGTSSQNVLFWGCHIFFLPSGYPINSIFQWHYIFITQQTFTLMKTPWRRLSSLEDVFKTSWSRRIYSP